MIDLLCWLIMQCVDVGEIECIVCVEGMCIMYEDGIVKVVVGVIMLEEVLCVMQEG